MSGASVGVSGQGSEALATAPKALATAPKALATAPKALAPRICLEGACQRPKFSKGRLRRAFGQWGPSARLAISCATLAARTSVGVGDGPKQETGLHKIARRAQLGF